ncbi:hypothetical protein GS482_11880 [Rhodococcus hoagii]|nr:hypothetical protein [Prescottella equi]
MYPPGATGSRGAVQPGADVFADHLTVKRAWPPGSSVRTSGSDDGKQSTLDHRRFAPSSEYTSTCCRPDPRSRSHALVPMFVMAIVKPGSSPALYCGWSGVTLSASDWSAQSLDGLADVVLLAVVVEDEPAPRFPTDPRTATSSAPRSIPSARTWPRRRSTRVVVTGRWTDDPSRPPPRPRPS